MALFSKKAESDTQKDDKAFKPDPRKARAWFERAETVAATRNYDYAIECYLNGLKFDPEAMTEQEKLREVALRRKANGGKPAGMLESMKRSGGKTPIDKLINTEFIWSKDPFDPAGTLAVMEQAMELELYELAFWAGELALEANRKSKKPNKQIFLKIRDQYASMDRYDKAVEACRAAVQQDPNNGALLAELKNLEAENTLREGQYGGEGDFRQSIRDREAQQKLISEDAVDASESMVDTSIAAARAEYEDNPEDFALMEKLVNQLLRKESTQAENEAIQLLKEAYEQSGTYRYKVRMGDIRIKQYNRGLRQLRSKLKQEPDNEQLKKKYQALALEQVKFELGEFEERVKNYPTDMSLRYQLGRRQLALKDYDAAIGSFQEAQGDPKNRAAALRYLGEAFNAKQWYDESIDTFRRGIESHGQDDDRLALELRYLLMDALENKARRDEDLPVAREAASLGSSIAQRDINFRDIRERIESLRSLIDSLRDKSSE